MINVQSKSVHPRFDRARLFFALLGVALFLTPPSYAEVQSVIAYVGPSIDNQEIRLIDPDGLDDRTMWHVPDEVHPLDGIGSLQWNPDGTELLFDSGHNWTRSIAIRDLYGLSTDGLSLRRVTDPPGSEAYDDLPKGTVTFIPNTLEQGDVQVYVDGARDPVHYLAKLGEYVRVTAEVADWGPEVRQYIRLYDPEPHNYYCHFAEVGWADVQPGEVTDLGWVNFSINTDYVCPRIFNGAWMANGEKIVYLRQDPVRSVNPAYNIWQIASHQPNGEIGDIVLNMNAAATLEKLYRAVPGPTEERADEMLILRNGTTVDHIFHSLISNPNQSEEIGLGLCPGINCQILDIVWLKDGSGFLISRHISGLSGVQATISRYSFADQTLHPIIELPNQAIGRLALSPNGRKVAFELADALSGDLGTVYRGPELQCPCAIAVVNMRGRNFHTLVEDGRAPAWTAVPAVEPTQ